MGFSRQEYWSGSPFPSPGDLPKPGIEPWSTALQANSLLSELPGKGPTINQRLKLTPWCHSFTLLWISYPISQRMLKTLFLKYGFFFCKNLATSYHLNHYLRYCPMSRSFLEHLCQTSALFPGQHLSTAVHACVSNPNPMPQKRFYSSFFPYLSLPYPRVKNLTPIIVI